MSHPPSFLPHGPAERGPPIALTPRADGEGAKAAGAARGLSLPHRREAGLCEILLIILAQKKSPGYQFSDESKREWYKSRCQLTLAHRPGRRGLLCLSKWEMRAQELAKASEKAYTLETT